MIPDVAVIIISYNSAPHLGKCLESVYAQCGRVSLEVIVLDNESEDESTDLVRRRFPTVKLIRPGRNLGFAAGVNHAARHATADYLLLLNPDTILLDHAIDVIVEFARRAPCHGLYGGRTLRADGELEPSSCWGLPSLWSLAMFASGMNSIGRRNRLFDPESLGKWPRDTAREVGIISGCYLLLPRAVWQELGGFDERFFMYGEDADLAIRARAAGYRPMLCPGARLIHHVGQSSTRADKLLLLQLGKATLLRTHWRGLSRWLGLNLLLTGTGVRALVALIVRRPTTERWLTVWRQRQQWMQGYSSVNAGSISQSDLSAAA